MYITEFCKQIEIETTGSDLSEKNAVLLHVYDAGRVEA